MVSQVVLGASADGHTDLRVDKVRRSATSGRREGHELHLGSQDLIRLADYAAKNGFHIASLIVSDSHLSPLVREENEETSDAMIEILARYGIHELEMAMRDEFDGLFVVGVNLIAKSSGKRISVRREGYIETSAVPQAEQLLRAAWRELHLS